MEMNLPGRGCRYWRTHAAALLLRPGPGQSPAPSCPPENTHLKDEVFKISFTNETDAHALK